MICWLSGHRPQYRSCTANRTVQYVARGQSSVLGEGGTKTWARGRLRSRDWTNSECGSDLVNTLLQILFYPSFWPQIWRWRLKKLKKGLHRKTLGYLITFTWSVLLFHRKKCLWWPVFGQKFASCATTKVYSRLGSSSSDLGDTARNAISRA